MDTMNEQERFLGILLGKDVDRFPFYDLEPAEETLDRWLQEGLSPLKRLIRLLLMTTTTGQCVVLIELV